MLIVSVDPGLSGGITALGLQGTFGREEDEVNVTAMPLRPHFSGKGNEIDVPAVLDFVLKHQKSAFKHPQDRTLLAEPIHIFIEKVGNMPRQRGGMVVKMGATSMFNFGDGFGILRGALEAMGHLGNQVVLMFPPPQTWQKVVFAGMSKGDTKKTALSFVSRRYPKVNLLKSPRCSVPHEGIVDSLAIAEYGRRQLVGTQTP